MSKPGEEGEGDLEWEENPPRELTERELKIKEIIDDVTNEKVFVDVSCSPSFISNLIVCRL